jgi:hypothetical protein
VGSETILVLVSAFSLICLYVLAYGAAVTILLEMVILDKL